MYNCLITCRSITYAQRISRALTKAGFSATHVRVPAGVLETGCGHAVKVYDRQLARILAFLQEEGYPAQKVFCDFGGGSYEERPV